MRQQIRIGKQVKGAQASAGVEKLLVGLFETSIKSFRHLDAVKTKLHDKTVSLHPPGASTSLLRKKHVPWRTGNACAAQPASCLN